MHGEWDIGSFQPQEGSRKKRSEGLKATKLVEKLGKHGFDWAYIPQFINDKSVVYGFGVGTDISFEVALADRHKCVVHTFDPTPQAIEYAVGIVKANPLVKFHAFGVLSRDTLIRFYKPKEYQLGLCLR